MPSTHHLSHPQRDELLALLQSRMAALERSQAERSAGLSQAEAAHEMLPQDDEEARDRAGVQDVQNTLSDIDAAASAALGSALQRIHTAEYGLCVDCGTAIAFERLKVEPQTLRCVACQTVLEQGTAP